MQYIDNFLIFWEDKKDEEKIKEALRKNFAMRDLGQVREFLGMKVEINKEKREIAIHQKAYIAKTLEKFRMSDCKSVKTPIDSNKKWMTENSVLESSEDEEEEDFPYLEAVGSLYLSQISRPYIAYAMNVLSSFLKNRKGYTGKQ